ncbi:hypothetical protein [Vibrio sp. PID17_43]|uniref:hypothetical protein n=1 Tax=Vibrio sp. PID17_43 TaxID=1583451 RepID=UPI000BFFC917|nr:hypothetical protein [Vibrio sp. PID17_43]PHJ42245.1 hypothetical protein AK965_07005 [Vibrio sp. PID17_43]
MKNKRLENIMTYIVIFVVLTILMSIFFFALSLTLGLLGYLLAQVISYFVLINGDEYEAVVIDQKTIIHYSVSSGPIPLGSDYEVRLLKSGETVVVHSTENFNNNQKVILLQSKNKYLTALFESRPSLLGLWWSKSPGATIIGQFLLFITIIKWTSKNITSQLKLWKFIVWVEKRRIKKNIGLVDIFNGVSNFFKTVGILILILIFMAIILKFFVILSYWYLDSKWNYVARCGVGLIVIVFLSPVFTKITRFFIKFRLLRYKNPLVVTIFETASVFAIYTLIFRLIDFNVNSFSIGETSLDQLYKLFLTIIEKSFT